MGKWKANERKYMFLSPASLSFTIYIYRMACFLNMYKPKNILQANTQEELPEVLLGTCRFNHLDASKAVLVQP